MINNMMLYWNTMNVEYNSNWTIDLDIFQFFNFQTYRIFYFFNLQFNYIIIMMNIVNRHFCYLAEKYLDHYYLIRCLLNRFRLYIQLLMDVTKRIQILNMLTNVKFWSIQFFCIIFFVTQFALMSYQRMIRFCDIIFQKIFLILKK